MMIYKYPLLDLGRQELMVPPGRILCVQMQRDTPCLWAMVDTDQLQAPNIIHVVGTGQPMPSGVLEYIGTVQDGSFVWHVFRERAR